jgi:hypothetical protein
MKSIILDAGHGGTDSGAVGFGVKEKDWALEMSQYQFKRLKELGARVAMTRKSDVTLSPTERIARVKNKYDVCVSNHWNAFDGSARGVEAIHSLHAKPTFANDLANSIVKASGLQFRRVFTREMSKGVDYYFMHRLTGKTETVIVEYGFIDNKQDNEMYQKKEIFQRTAEAVIEGICQKIGVTYKAPNTDSKHKKDPTQPINNYLWKRVESIYDGELRYYNKPSWKDEDVYGHLTKGMGFPTIIDKVRVGKGEQYKVKNSKEQVFYVTASPKYVRVV